MKKILSVLLAVLMLIGTMPLSAFAIAFNDGTMQWEDPVTAAFGAGHVVADPGEIVTVPVAIQNNPGIISFKLKIGYDDTALELLEVTQTQYASLVVGPLTKNPLTVNWCEGDRAENCTDEGEFLLLTFAVKETVTHGAYPITLTYDQQDVFNIEFEDVVFATAAGSVTIRGEDHVYDNACDPDCNICGEQRDVEDHVYSNVCDRDCNVCGAIRTPPHIYDNACDTACNLCGALRRVGDHVYDNACDTACNECGVLREAEPHIYDNACDPDCNLCGAVREVPSEHSYDHACDAECNDCGFMRVPASHIYDFACDAFCNVCGAQRDAKDHVFTDPCDRDCNVCGELRVPPHMYDNACDDDCNACGELRVPSDHAYTNAADDTCNECGYVRELNYIHESGAAYYEYPLPFAFQPTRSGRYRFEFYNHDNPMGFVGVEFFDADGNAIPYVDKSYVTGENFRPHYTVAIVTVTAGERYAIYAHGLLSITVEYLCDHAYDHACDPDCNVCGAIREVEPHAYFSEVTTPATCVDNGVMTYTCAHCGDSYTASIPATGVHDYAETRVEPDCVNYGELTFNCVVCGDTFSADLVPLGHNPGAPADCENDQVCTVCGAVVTPATGHVYDSVVTAPTCENGGYTTYTCSVCGDSYVTDETDALEHEYFDGVLTMEPTCVTDGVLTYTCAHCGDSFTESIPATGVHTYDSDADSTCNVCGEVREAAVLYGDLNGDGKVNIRDLGLLQQKLNGWNITIVETAADLNGDQKINIRDLGLLQQHLNGWNIQFGG